MGIKSSYIEIENWWKIIKKMDINYLHLLLCIFKIDLSLFHIYFIEMRDYTFFIYCNNSKDFEIFDVINS